MFTESPASNTFEVQDIPAIAKAAHAAGAIVMMDNTWATPLYFRPLDHGVDISIHAATKYPAGHSDVLLGTVSANDGLLEAALRDASVTLGCCAGPDDVYQVLRGLRTMGVRLERHQKSALDIAAWLEAPAGRRARAAPGAAQPSRPRAVEARFLRLERHLLHRARRRRPEAAACLPRCAARSSASAIPGAAIESLAVPVFLGDRTIAKGPYEGPLIRLQIGLEDVEDLKADMVRGLAAAASA